MCLFIDVDCVSFSEALCIFTSANAKIVSSDISDVDVLPFNIKDVDVMEVLDALDCSSSAMLFSSPVFELSFSKVGGF